MTIELPAIVHDASFPLRSPMSRRDWVKVEDAELLEEAEAELERQLRTAPGMIARGALTPADAEHRAGVWAAIVADRRHFMAWRTHCSRGVVVDQAERLATTEHPFTPGYADRVIEIRRELALRRRLYPKWIAEAQHPLGEAEAVRKLEALDALYRSYWEGGQGLYAPRGDDRRPSEEERRALCRAFTDVRRAQHDAAEQRAAAGQD